MALQTIDAYCTEDDLDRYLSENGVLLSVDDNAGGTIGAGVEQDSIEDAIVEATEEINLYCSRKYSYARLATSNLINRWCTCLAAANLRMRKGNPIPQSIQDKADYIREQLERVRQCELFIPGIPVKRSSAPSMVNVTVDPRRNYHVVRVQKRNSVGRQTRLPQRIDRAESITPDPSA